MSLSLRIKVTTLKGTIHHTADAFDVIKFNGAIHGGVYVGWLALITVRSWTLDTNVI